MTVINHLQFGEDAISEGLWRVVLSVLPELQPVPYPAAHFISFPILVNVIVCVHSCSVASVMSESLQPYGL